VASLLLSSCGAAVEEEEAVVEEEEAVVEEEEEAVEEEVVTPTEGEPQYGGKLVWVYNSTSLNEPPSPSIQVGSVYSQWWLTPIQERPLIADFEKYGPRGTGEYPFQLFSYIPEAYVVGNWIDSWTVEPDKLTWHIRPGVMWSPNEEQQAWMQPRELTAEDAVADALLWRDAPTGKWNKGFISDIYTDGDNMVMETTRQDATWFVQLGYEDRTLIAPPEMVERDDTKWENQVGTGPFRFEEYVPGSHMSYTPNPLFRKTTTIDGVEYKIPFVDQLIFPIIPDDSTRISALRTGNLDALFRVPWDYQFEIEEHAPQLLTGYQYGYGYHGFTFACWEPPFDNVDVRRAISMGIDRKAFRDQVGLGETAMNWFPVSPNFPETIYTPLDKCSELVQEVYTYDKDASIQALADAGYPDGIKTEIWCTSEAYRVDGASMLADQLSMIGVDCDIVVKDPLIGRGHQYGKTYNGIYWGGSIGEIDRPETYLTRKWLSYEYYNYSGYGTPEMDANLLAMAAEMDPDKRAPMIKELAQEMYGLCAYVPCASGRNAAYVWPWIRNWYNELCVGDHDAQTLAAYVWIDEDLKKEMGY
ncbi:ABC transporter substrate-binding protein, partial [Chloroflexota bacterium]